MRVLDLFSGLGGFSQAFVDRGHYVITLDNNPCFHPTLCMSIMDIELSPMLRDTYFDVILASPPCECFSVASVGKHWVNGFPDDKTLNAIGLVKKSLNFIIDKRPRFWFLENPRGMLRTIIGNPPVTVFYAQYGEDRLKPTDIWGCHPKGFKSMQVTDKSLLDYTPAPRGSRTGTQGLRGSAERSKVPYQLSECICKLCERGLR